MVAFEAFHSISHGKVNNINHFALELDLSKAFNRLEWNYLESVMVAMRFPLSLVTLIMNCVCSVQFLALINGVPSPSHPNTGYPIGDPLSLSFYYL